ncbi:hypothetical protein LNQ03_20720 [Klebsiella pneumoniae subsp. pneumoniae]|nr:hypothetical protein [Klebsiella pneumoniae subsp. pneumoniae]
MTPQLQQAIRLLQLSTLELQQELQQALESNPLLEQTGSSRRGRGKRGGGPRSPSIPSMRLSKRDARRTASRCQLG